jgi:hypothetical protein
MRALCASEVGISGFQDFRISGFQDFRISGFQDFRISGFQDFRMGRSTRLQEENILHP